MSGYRELVEGKPGTTVRVSPDWWVLNDGEGAEVPALLQGRQIAYPDRVRVFIDHDTPCGSVEAALQQKELIALAEAQGLELYNGSGISHQIMLDEVVKAGQVVAGCVNHPAVYGAAGALALALSPGELVKSLRCGAVEAVVPERVCIRLEGALQAPATARDLALSITANTGERVAGRLLVFSGAGAEELSPHQRRVLCQLPEVWGVLFDSDCTLEPICAIHLDEMVPLVAGPHTLGWVQRPDALQGTRLNEVFLGGCAGGSLEDLRLAAGILRGRRIPQRVRLMVAPATSEVYMQAADEGLLADLMDAGAILMNQGCSVCWGRSQGIVDEQEVLLSTGSYNYRGCAGAEGAGVYLCSPAVAAWSALAGSIQGGAS